MHRQCGLAGAKTQGSRCWNSFIVITAAAHLYAWAIVWFYIFQQRGKNGIAGKSPSHGVAQLQSTDRAPAQHFKHSSSEKTSAADRCQGRLSENNRKRREIVEKKSSLSAVSVAGVY